MMLDDESIRRPLANLDLDEGPNAPPINQQLKDALASNAVKVIDLFKSWDDNGDGLIERKEFEQGLRALGLDVPTSIINDLFYSWDSDGSGELSMREVSWRRGEDPKRRPFFAFRSLCFQDSPSLLLSLSRCRPISSRGCCTWIAPSSPSATWISTRDLMRRPSPSSSRWHWLPMLSR